MRFSENSGPCRGISHYIMKMTSSSLDTALGKHVPSIIGTLMEENGAHSDMDPATSNTCADSKL